MHVPHGTSGRVDATVWETAPRIVLGESSNPREIAISNDFDLARFGSSMMVAQSGFGYRVDTLVEAIMNTVESTEYGSGISDSLKLRNKILEGIRTYPTSADFLGFADRIRANIKPEIASLKTSKEKIIRGRVTRDEADLLRAESQKKRSELKSKEESELDFLECRLGVMEGLLQLVNNTEIMLIRQSHVEAMSKYLGILRGNGPYEVLEFGSYMYRNRASHVPTLNHVVVEVERELSGMDAFRLRNPKYEVHMPDWVAQGAMFPSISREDIANIKLITKPFVVHGDLIIR